MKKIYLAILVCLLVPLLSSAKIGVGVGTGKITMDKPLKPGGIYELPPFAVINTGDEASDYETSIQYHEKQAEERPDRDWFDFNPGTFALAPGEVNNVSVTIRLPFKVKPGSYFAYVEARPAKKSESGKTAISVAAASKLYFTVEPANVFQGLYYKLAFLFKEFYPWSYVSGVIIILAALLLTLKRFFTFNIGVSLKK